MNNRDYWIQRTKEQAARTDKAIDEICGVIERAYQEASANIDQQILMWYARYAEDNEVSMADAKRVLSQKEMAGFRMSLEEYIRHGEELDVHPEWLQAMKNASAKHHVDRLTSLKMTTRAELEHAYAVWKAQADAGLDHILTDVYLRTSFNLDKDIGVLEYINGADIQKLRVIANKPWAPDGMDFVTRAGISNVKLVNEVQRQLMQSCITGRPYEELAENLQKATGLQAYQAQRIIRTEATHMSTVAAKESYRAHNVKEYEYLATLDNKTCDVCGPLDGTHYRVVDMVEGVNAPPMHPNCRCDTAPYYDTEKLASSRAARDENGKTIFIDGNTTWEDWREEQKANIRY